MQQRFAQNILTFSQSLSNEKRNPSWQNKHVLRCGLFRSAVPKERLSNTRVPPSLVPLSHVLSFFPCRSFAYGRCNTFEPSKQAASPMKTTRKIGVGKRNLYGSVFFSQIDLEELMHALKQERTAKKVLSKGKHGPEQRQDLAEKDKPGSGGVASDGDNGDDGHKEPAESSEDNVSATKGSRSNGSVGAEELEGAGEGGESSSRAEETVNDTSAAEQRQKLQDDKKERPLFSLEEAESLTAYLVESQQAFSLINVADIQRGELG